jgi:hypothetical protein
MGIQLVAGWNTVVYGGSSGVPADVFASVVPYLKPWDSSEDATNYPIWVYRTEWLEWHPGVPPEWWDLLNTLKYVYNGETCSIYVTQDCYWSWEVAASKTGLIIGAAIAAVAIIGSVYLVTRKS